MPPPTETWRRLPAMGKLSTYTSSWPVSDDVYAIQRPPGETCACVLLNRERANGTGSPPAPTGRIHRSMGLSLPKTIRWPSGDQSHTRPPIAPTNLAEPLPRAFWIDTAVSFAPRSHWNRIREVSLDQMGTAAPGSRVSRRVVPSANRVTHTSPPFEPCAIATYAPSGAIRGA